MANQHDTPQLHSFKSFSFNFHALRRVSHTPACISGENGYQRHVRCDMAEFFSRCYLRFAQLPALIIPPKLRSTARRCASSAGSVMAAAVGSFAPLQHRLSLTITP